MLVVCSEPSESYSQKTGEQTAVRERGEEDCEDLGVKLEVESSVCLPRLPIRRVPLSARTRDQPSPSCLRYEGNRDVQGIGSEVWNTLGWWEKETDIESTFEWSYVICTLPFCHIFPVKCDPAILGFCSVTQHKSFFRVHLSVKGQHGHWHPELPSKANNAVQQFSASVLCLTFQRFLSVFIKTATCSVFECQSFKQQNIVSEAVQT